MTSPSIEEIVAADNVKFDSQNDLNLRTYIPSMSYAMVANDGSVSFIKPPKNQSKPSFSPEQDKKSTIGKIRRLVMGIVRR